jgi:hypothetical protein
MGLASNTAAISPVDQMVPQPLARLESENEYTAPAAMDPAGLRLEDYAAIMIAGRSGVKGRETPGRDAPLIVRVGRDRSCASHADRTPWLSMVPRRSSRSPGGIRLTRCRVAPFQTRSVRDSGHPAVVGERLRCD